MVEPRSAEGAYQLIQRLGTGSVSEVYLAVQQGPGSFERQIVIKRLLSHLNENADAVESFCREARVLSQLQHPHVVQIYELGCERGAWFMALEYVRGIALQEIYNTELVRKRPLPWDFILNLLSQLAMTLADVHNASNPRGQALKIVHCDVSPRNVYIQHEGWVKLLDFGVASSALNDSSFKAGQAKGTLGYASPEQVRGEAVDERADIFALGVLLYELSTAKRLFGGDHLSSIDALFKERFVLPRQLIDGYPEELEQLVLSALALDPNQRLQSARAFGDAIERCADIYGVQLHQRVLADYLRLHMSLTMDIQIDPALGRIRRRPSQTRILGTETSFSTELTPLKELQVFSEVDALSGDLGEPTLSKTASDKSWDVGENVLDEADIERALDSVFPSHYAVHDDNERRPSDPLITIESGDDEHWSDSVFPEAHTRK